MRREDDKQSQNREITMGIALVSQMAVAMLVPIFVGIFGGHALDQWLGTEPWVLLIGIAVGIAAGYRNVWHMVRRYTKQKKTSEPQPINAKRSEAEEAFLQWRRERGEEENGETHE